MTPPAPMSRAAAASIAALAVLLFLGLLGFSSSFGGWMFLVPGFGGAALGLAVGWFSALRRWSILPAYGAAVLVFLVFGGPLALPGTTIAGVIPTLETVRGLILGATAGWKELITSVPPVGATEPLLVVPFLTGILGGVLGARLALRSRPPFLPMIAPLAVLSASILVGTRFPVSVLLQGTVMGIVAIGWVAWRSAAEAGPAVGVLGLRRMGAAAAVLAVAGAVSIPLGPRLPLAESQPRFTLREQAEPPVDPSIFATPLGSVRKYTTQLKDETVLTVSGLPGGSRLRFAAMDTYDGLVWGVSGATTGEGGSSGAFARIGSQPEGSDGGPVREVAVTVGAYRDVWVPDAGQVLGVAFDGQRSAELSDAFRYNRATGTGLSLVRLAEGDSYRMTVALPVEPDPESLVKLAPSVVPATAVTEVAAVSKLQGDLSAGAEAKSLYEQAKALTDQLYEQGYYSNGDTSAGKPPSLPGHGQKRISDFAASDPLIGDEEQYVSAAALMVTKLGVPVRVVLGAKMPADAEGAWEVKGSQVTAWLEAGLGGNWVPLDMVPEKDKPLPEVQQTKPRPELAPQQPLPPPPPDTSEAASASRVEAPEIEEDSDGGWSIPGPILFVLRTIGLPLLAVGLIIGGMAAAKALRRRRRRTTGHPSTRIAGGWAEVSGIARDFGAATQRQATRQEMAQGFDVPAATALAQRADAAVFGPDSPTDDAVAEFWAGVDEFHRDIRGRHPWYRRLLAVVSLRSWRP